MKILTVCQRGNNRSAALAYILRDERGPNEVLNYGPEAVSKETEKMLCEWADKIFITTSQVNVPLKYQHKCILVDVGPDKWGIGFHSDLLQKLREGLDEREEVNNMPNGWEQPPAPPVPPAGSPYPQTAPEPQVPQQPEEFKGLPVRAGGDRVFLLKDGKKHWVMNAEAYARLGFKFGDEVKIDEATLAVIPESEPIK